MFNSSSASAQSFVALVCNTTYLHNSVVRAVQRDYALLNQTSADRAISTQATHTNIGKNSSAAMTFGLWPPGVGCSVRIVA